MSSKFYAILALVFGTSIAAYLDYWAVWTSEHFVYTYGAALIMVPVGMLVTLGVIALWFEFGKRAYNDTRNSSRK